MARPAENKLTIKALPKGRFLLHGRIRGKQIRVRSKDRDALEALRHKHEMDLIELEAQEALLKPRLSDGEKLKAEARELRARLAGYDIDEILELGLKHWVGGGKVECAVALNSWLASQKDRHRFKRTIDNNRVRTSAFIRYLAEHEKTTLDQITPIDCERYVLGEGVSQRTQVTRGRVIRAWLHFCVKRRHLKESPFTIDLEDLSARARPQDPPLILTPEQSSALVQAAASLYGGEMLSYVGLTLFCFLRHAEAVRTTRGQVKLALRNPVVEVLPRKRGTVSYRTVNVPTCAAAMLSRPVVFKRRKWERIREVAGLIKRGPLLKNGRRKITPLTWQDNILRHTGISYHYQLHGNIQETTRQAGNSSDVAFRHYLTLPEEGAAEKFYSAG